MISAERYDVAVNGSPTDATGLRRLGALAFTHQLLELSPAHLTSISIHEQVTGELRASWTRQSDGWSAHGVLGWLS